MEINITNQPGGIIQQTDKPIINNFVRTAEEAISITQSVISASAQCSGNLNESGASATSSTKDPLRLLLGNDELYREVVARLHTCEKAEHIKQWVCTLIKERHPKGKDMIFGSDFVNLIIPHLTNYTQSKNAKTIQNAIL